MGKRETIQGESGSEDTFFHDLFCTLLCWLQEKEQLGSKTERRLPLAKEPQGLIASFSWSN
jgi:hypothetical protein